MSQSVALKPFHPHQAEAMGRLKASLRQGHRRVIIQAPTGSGKSILAAHIITGALNKNKRVAFVVPLLNLIDQSFERFVENGIEPNDMGVIQGTHEWRRPDAPVQICSIQTLARRGFPKADVVIVDEVHLRYEAVDRWIASCPDKIFIGLSASPWSRGLADNWQDLIVAATIKELIEQGYLSKFKVFAPAHPDLSGIKVVKGDYETSALSERMQDGALVADVVQTWLARAYGLATLVFAVDRAHAAVLHAQFEGAGVASAYVDANTPREERSHLARQFQSGEITVICSVGTMTTGVDLDVRCIIYARPTKSEMLFVQCMGRGLRTAPGKNELLILDHSDTHLRLGLVTDIHHDRLYSGKKNGSGSGDDDRESAVKPLRLPRECPKCAYLIPAGEKKCTECGFELRPVSQVETIDGELFEIGAVSKVALKRNHEMTWPEKVQFMAELKGYAYEFGHKEGWTAHKYKAKCGVWPNDPRVKHAAPLTCGPSVRSWIRGQNVRWAKSNQKKPAVEPLHA